MIAPGTSAVMPQQTPLEQMALTKSTQVPAEPCFDRRYYALWLADVLGPASAYARALLAAFGDAKAVYEGRETTQFAKIVGAKICKKSTGVALDPAVCAARLARCAQQHITVLCVEDAQYPVRFRKMQDLPLVLYCTGEVAILNVRPCIGMVGARRPTAYGVSAAAEFGDAFARSGAVIVSGLADGLDGESHRAAVRAGTPTIGIMGVPITMTYPAGNALLRREIEACGGLTISEYPEGYQTDYKHTFLQRNRMIAALSDILVVIEARSKSGTMSTVCHAERYGTPIFAVPGSVFSGMSEGTNSLIATGRAKMLVQAHHVLDAVHLATVPPPKKEIKVKKRSKNAALVFSKIGTSPIGLVALGEQTGLAMGALLAALTALEVGGDIIAQPGRQYTIK